MLIVVASVTAGARVGAQQAAGAVVETDIATAPVEFDGAELFRVRGVSSLPAEARARLIRDRLTAVAADPSIAVDSSASLMARHDADRGGRQRAHDSSRG